MLCQIHTACDDELEDRQQALQRIELIVKWHYISQRSQQIRQELVDELKKIEKQDDDIIVRINELHHLHRQMDCHLTGEYKYIEREIRRLLKERINFNQLKNQILQAQICHVRYKGHLISQLTEKIDYLTCKLYQT